MKSYVVLLSGLLLMAPAAAQTADTNTSNQQPAPNAGTAGTDTSAPATDPNRRICRKVETNTGSRVPHRTVCLTERQWQNYRPN